MQVFLALHRLSLVTAHRLLLMGSKASKVSGLQELQLAGSRAWAL